jgi:3',5'-cyclic AMP phosphodiesterase CpdA
VSCGVDFTLIFFYHRHLVAMHSPPVELAHSIRGSAAAPHSNLSQSLTGAPSSRAAQVTCGRFAFARKKIAIATLAVLVVAGAAVALLHYVPPLLRRAAAAPPSAAAAAPGVRMLVIGDSGSGDATQFRVAAQMDSFAADAYARSQAQFAALLHVGDAVYDINNRSGGGDPSFFEERITRPYLSPLRAQRFLVALGNHDTVWGDNGAALLALSNLTSRFYEQVLTGGGGVSVQLIVLDSNCEGFWVRINATLAEEQAVFLDAALARGSYTWRIVVFHHPVFSCARHRSQTPKMQRWLLPIIAKRGNVNLVLSGHDHK